MRHDDSTFLIVVIFLTAMCFAFLILSARDNSNCPNRKCPSGMSPTLVQKPTRCVCEIPAQ